MTASRRRGAPGARGDGTRLLGGLVPRRGRGMRRADDGARSARPSVPDRPGPAAAMAAKGRSGQMAHGAGRQGYGRRVYTRWRRTDRARTTAKYDDGTEHRDLTGPRAAKVSNGETSWRMTNTQVHVRLISAGRSRGKYILSHCGLVGQGTLGLMIPVTITYDPIREYRGTLLQLPSLFTRPCTSRRLRPAPQHILRGIVLG